MTGQIAVRCIQETDYPFIVQLLDALGYPATLPAVTEQLACIRKDMAYHTLVAEADGCVVGFIGLCKLFAYEANGCYVRILALSVDGQHRGCGVGTTLVEAAQAWARSVGAGGIALDSGIRRKKAHNFYQKRGYSLTQYGFTKSLDQMANNSVGEVGEAKE